MSLSLSGKLSRQVEQGIASRSSTDTEREPLCNPLLLLAIQFWASDVECIQLSPRVRFVGHDFFFARSKNVKSVRPGRLEIEPWFAHDSDH